MTNENDLRNFKNITLESNTNAIRTLVELKVSGLVVLSKKYYFMKFSTAQLDFCKKYKSNIEMYENGKEFLKSILM